MTRLRWLATCLAVGTLTGLVGACGGKAITGSTSPAPTPSGSPSIDSSAPPRPSPEAAQLPAQLHFTKLVDLGGGGPAVLTSTGLWIASAQKDQLIQFTSPGGPSSIDLPAQPAGSAPQGIAAAPDGSIWISESESVLRVDNNRQVTTFSIQGQPNGLIAPGPDQAMWVAELGKDRVARIMDGQVREFPLPSAPMDVQCGGRCPYGIASGPDGNLWITESQLASGDLVGRMTPDGQYEDWPLPHPGAALNNLTVGPDGALWFGESRARSLGRITTQGVVSEQAVELPADASGTKLVSAGGGLIWYAPDLAPAYAEDPIAVGAALPGGASRTYEVAGAKGPVASIVPVPAPQGEAVDVVTWSGQVWQGVST